MTSHKFEVAAVAIIAAGMFCAGARGDILAPLRTWDMDRIKSILIVAGGCLLFFLVFGTFFRRQSIPYTLDWKVDNTALAYDPQYGCVLVAARNTHKIEGRDRHVPGNLPANIWFYDTFTAGENLYVVDFYHKFGSPGHPTMSVEAVKSRDDFNWIPFDEPMEVVPRGAGENWSGFLADQMAGYNYENYVLPKGTRPDISAPGVKKQRKDGSWHVN